MSATVDPILDRLDASLIAFEPLRGNIPAIARKAYIHPKLIDAANRGDFNPPPRRRAMRHVSSTERALTA